jgi:hypothetical protein
MINPALRAKSTFRAHYLVLGGRNVDVIVYDTAKLPNIEKAFVGYLSLSAKIDRHPEDVISWVAGKGAAKSGYGLFLYTLGATLVRDPVHPSDDLSREARMFWGKQHAGLIQPVSPAVFEAQFGISLQHLVRPKPEDITTLVSLIDYGWLLIATAHGGNIGQDRHDPDTNWGKSIVRETRLWKKGDVYPLENISLRARSDARKRQRLEEAESDLVEPLYQNPLFPQYIRSR